METHGGNIYAAAREAARPIRDFLDFSASINPLGMSSKARAAILACLPRLVHYPDPDCVSLRTAIAATYNLDAETLLVGNGSTELIHYLPRALAIRHALIAGPTFSEYARSVVAAGGQVTRVQGNRRNGYRWSVDHLLASLRRGVDTVYVCNPNSPTGQVVSRSQLLALVQALAPHGIRLVVDEAFADYCEEHSVLEEAGRVPGLLVLRSFTKFFAMPGLRLGYLAGPLEVVERVRRILPPWSVSVVAQEAAAASLRDTRYRRRSLAFMKMERERFARALSKLPGVRVLPSSANFLLVELPLGTRAARVVRELRESGLLVRDCGSFIGMGERAVRVAVRRPNENRHLAAALARLLKG